MNHARSIAIVGSMGAGKSVVARALGARLDLPVADLDAWVEAEAKMTLSELFANQGEPVFRDFECRALGRALDGTVRIVACGGGVVERPANRRLLRERCRTVWLQVTPREAAARLGPGRATRPLVAGGDLEAKLAELLLRRTPWYEEVADVSVDTTGRNPEQVARDVLARLGAPA